MKTSTLLIIVLTLLACTGLASALQVSSPLIGGENQDRIKNVTSTFTITNDGLDKLENIILQHSADPKYEIEFTNVPIELGPGESAPVTIKGNIPLDFDSTDKTNLEKKIVKIGEITVTADEISANATIINQVSKKAEINMQAVNQINIRRVIISCGDLNRRLNDGDRIDDLKPGLEDCILTVEVENTFKTSDRDNLKIGDIEFDPLTIEVESDDYDIDLNDYEDLRIFARDREELSFDFSIYEEAKDGTYSIYIRAYGKDENEAFHGQIWEIKLRVNRLRYEVSFKRVGVTPNEIETCGEKSTRVSATISNIGRRDTEAAVELRIPEFGYLKKIENIDLYVDDQTTVYFDVQIPEDVKEGIYTGTLKSFFDNLAESNTKTVEIRITKCTIPEPKQEEEPAEEKKETTIIIPKETQPVIPPKAATSTQTTESTSEKFTESTAYVGLLLGLIVVLLFSIILIFAVYFLRKKK
jgi:hypothetical protein